MTLKRYLNKEIILAATAVLLILMLIFLSQQFVRFLAEAVDGKINPNILLLMVGLQLPPLIGFLLPLSLFLGILLAFGQLYVENELVVARSVGVGDRDLAKMVMPTTLVVFVLAAIFSLVIAPWAAQKQQSLLKEQDNQSELQFLSPGRFQENSDGSGIMYVAGSDNSGQLEQLFFATLPSEEEPFWKIVTAEKGDYWKDQEAHNFVVLNQGVLSQIPTQDLSWGIQEFQRYYMRIPLSENSDRKQKSKSVSTAELLANLDPQAWSELHWRLSVPISIPLLVLLAIPLSRVQPRQGKFAKMFPALLLYMSYIIFMLMSRGWIEKNKLPGEVGFWWLHFLFAWYVYWQYRHPHRKIKRRQKAGAQ